MESYTPIEVKRLAPFSRKMIFIFGVAGLAYGIYARNYMWIISTFMMILVSVYNKNITVNESGIQFFYRIAFYTRIDYWPMAEIEYLHRERVKKALVMLHFTRGAMSRRLLFSESDSEKVVALVKRINPNVYIDDTGQKKSL